MCSIYDHASRSHVYILEAVGLFSGSVGVWLHHIPYITCTAGFIAYLASQSSDIMFVFSTTVCLSVCLYVC